ncbi:MAG: Ig-like domain-containing protein [Nitrolancea sp.]
MTSRAPAFVHISAILALIVFMLTPVLTQAADPPPFGTIRLTPISQTLTVGGTANFVINAINPWGAPIANVSVKLTITGANAGTTTSATTNGIGRATLSYIGSHSGSDTVFATGTYQSQNVDSSSVTVIWNSSTTNSVVLSPTGASAPINTSKTFTATLKDGTGAAIGDARIRFSVTGANPVSGTNMLTGSDGKATFTYTGTVAGTDTVSAFYDEDKDNVQEGDEPGASTSMTWIGYNIALATSGSSAAVNSTQNIVATVTDTEGDAMANIVVHFKVTGVNPTNGVRTTDANGKATFSYTGTHNGVDTISVYADINGNVIQDGNDPSASVTLTWSTSSLTLSPLNTAAALGTSQTLTATVKNSNNAVMPNVIVRFTVTGVNPTSGTGTTNSNGQTSFSFVGKHAGVDTITAYADVDNDNAQDNGEPGASTTISWANATISLSPLNVSAAVTTSQTFTVTVKNTAGDPLNGVMVRFKVTGANPTSGSGTTDANGHASFTYTGNHPGVDTLSAYADIDVDNAQDSTEPGASTTVTWTNASLTLTLSNSSAQVGTTQTVTATILNANNQAIVGITVRFKITGANPTTVNVVTNANGKASFSYKGINAGTDTIHAYGDLDADGVQDSGDPVSNVALTWTTTPTPPPTPVVPTQPASPKAGCTYFPQTQHNLCAGFAAYWNQFGGLAIYGYPLTEEFQQNGITVQYFERARFEWHPGVWPSRYDVLLGLLGNELTAGRNTGAFQRTAASSSSDCVYFQATGHNLCGGFRAYWNQFGGLAVFGMPISEPFQENGVTVQYFERQRFEWHPGAWPAHYDVLLGRVGAEVLGVNP